MADIRPFRGVLFNSEHVRLGGVLAPPYDVISAADRTDLYARDLRNIVRIDSGETYANDEEGVNDSYTRGAGHLKAWLDMGILGRTETAGYVVTAHEFTMPDGSLRRRMGVLGTVAARPWPESNLHPHERTLRGPKEDRLRLMRATRTQTSAVFALWDGADLNGVFADISATPAYLGGRTSGEFGSEKHLVWSVTDPGHIATIADSLAGARLYVADGHHRYETAVAYAAERRAAQPDAPDGADFERCLVYLCAADDASMAILPTHRLVLARPGMPVSVSELAARLPEGVEVVEVDDLDAATRAAGLRRTTHHAFGVVLAEGACLVARQRSSPSATPRAGLDVTVVEDILLGRFGIDASAISEGALAYSRNGADIAASVGSGAAAIGITLNPVSVAEVMAVANAGEVMPQKSTYFYPKVPTGIVLAPL